jgi:hypothetical protein
MRAWRHCTTCPPGQLLCMSTWLSASPHCVSRGRGSAAAAFPPFNLLSEDGETHCCLQLTCTIFHCAVSKGERE